MHDTIAAAPAEPTLLSLEDGLHPQTPDQFSAWMQLVLTWGQNSTGRVLSLTEEAIHRVQSGGNLSDIEVIAVTLAEEIQAGGRQIETDIKHRVKIELARRRTLTRHNGDGASTSSSIILAGQVFSNRTSPDLHALWEGKLAIEETARTLYHDVWPEPNAPEVLRPALLEFGEQLLEGPSGISIGRVSFPDSYPTQGSSGRFRTLGFRAPQARGLALTMANRARQRAKPVTDEIGEIVFELVQNTEWHASHWAGGRTGANCRVVAFREYSFDRADLAAAAVLDPDFIAYARAVGNEARRQSSVPLNRLVFGAITVIDSGVGLARSVALSLDEGEKFDSSTEVTYLIRALNKSLRVRRADMGNIGLPRVQQSLTNLRGYMSIRTGTVAIRRDFANRPFEVIPVSAASPPQSLFVDWVPDLNDDFIIGPRVGTAVTIVYPVEFQEAT